MGKAPKSAKKFAASGQLKKTIHARRKFQQKQKRIQGRRGASNRGRGAKGRNGEEDEDAESGLDEDEGEEDEEEVSAKKSKGKKKGMSVDDFLSGGFMPEGSDDEEDGEDEGEQDDEGDDEEDDEAGVDDDDDENFSDLDELDDADSHFNALSELATKDPEFYKFLQENDKELLEFDPKSLSSKNVAEDDEDDDEDENAAEDDDDDDLMDVENEQAQIPTLTTKVLQKWQKALLHHNSLRALRQLLVAFRSAAHMNDESAVLRWKIDSATVYNKLLTTAFRYTPVVLAHHIPYRTLSNGRIKPPSPPARMAPLTRLVLSYFANATHLFTVLTDQDLLAQALQETSKVLPWVVTGRRAVRNWIKRCLEMWSSSPHDRVRIAGILAVRKLIEVGDESMRDAVLKNAYLTLVRASKSTSAHTLPFITLMKNSASELFAMDHASAYPHAFGYIRQLAIHLRNSIKVKTKESYKLVYNWQYAHSIDFWSLVLARTCSKTAERGSKESHLKPLIYPLVQVSLGALRLISNSRSYPFHLHILRSLLHLTRHTQVYVPLSAYLLPILSSSLSILSSSSSSSSSRKGGGGGTLKPLDLEAHIRAPAPYARARVLAEGLIDESAYVLAEWLASPGVHASVGYPELVVPVVVSLRKMIKGVSSPSSSVSGSGSKGKGKGKKKKGVGAQMKAVTQLKALVERIEESAVWVDARRKKVKFGPGETGEVEAWERETRDLVAIDEDDKSRTVGGGGKGRRKGEESPLVGWVRVQRKERKKRRELLDKARLGEVEEVGDDDDDDMDVEQQEDDEEDDEDEDLLEEDDDDE